MTRPADPPLELPTGAGIYPCRALPFGEPAHAFHAEHPGRVYSWADVRMPRKEVPLLEDHDGPQIGLAFGFIKTREAMWCSVKLARRGEELLARGHTAISPEVTEDGSVIALALVASGVPGFASARIVLDQPTPPLRREPLAPRDPLAFRGLGVQGIGPRSMTLIGPRFPQPPAREFRVPDPFIRDSNPPDPEIEAARLRAQFEDWQRSIRELEKDPEQQLREMMARNKREWDRQRERERQRDLEREALGVSALPEHGRRPWTERHQALTALAEAVALAEDRLRKRWWRRLLRRGTGGRL